MNSAAWNFAERRAHAAHDHRAAARHRQEGQRQDYPRAGLPLAGDWTLEAFSAQLARLDPRATGQAERWTLLLIVRDPGATGRDGKFASGLDPPRSRSRGGITLND
jgi:hypothetical protein